MNLPTHLTSTVTDLSWGTTDFGHGRLRVWALSPNSNMDIDEARAMLAIFRLRMQKAAHPLGPIGTYFFKVPVRVEEFTEKELVAIMTCEQRHFFTQDELRTMLRAVTVRRLIRATLEVIELSKKRKQKHSVRGVRDVVAEFNNVPDDDE